MSDFILLSLFGTQALGWIGFIFTMALLTKYEDRVKSRTPQPEIYLIDWGAHPRYASLKKWNERFVAMIIFSGIPLLLIGWFLASQDGGCSGRFVDFCDY